MITAATCMALALYYEARGEGVKGMEAVAQVITNRVAHPDFPSTVCEVITEDRGPEKWDCQFSFYCDGKPERPRDVVAWSTARDIAAKALTGNTNVHDATYFHANNVKPYWASKFSLVSKVGRHVFYRDGSPPGPTRPRLRPNNFKN